MRRSRAPLTVAIAIAVILFIVIPAAGGFFADLWWFRELNYQVVFIKNLTTRALLFLAAGGVASAVLFLNLKLAQRGVVPEPVLVKMGEAVEPVDIAGMAQRLRKPCLLYTSPSPRD